MPGIADEPVTFEAARMFGNDFAVSCHNLATGGRSDGYCLSCLPGGNAAAAAVKTYQAGAGGALQMLGIAVKGAVNAAQRRALLCKTFGNGAC